jgi:hypothetical protein
LVDHGIEGALVNRPTPEDLARATDQLETLAYRHHDRNSPTCFPDIALLLELVTWLHDELTAAKEAAAYGPGSSAVEAHTVGRLGHGRPVEDRFHFGPRARPELRDQLVRDLGKVDLRWRSRFRQFVDDCMEDSKDVANWPHRTRDAG